MRTAFKEWAVIVEALGRGDQILILRKGGIAEGRGGFQVDHSRFLLFPTQFHQQRDQVIPAGQVLFDEMATRAPRTDSVAIHYVATVTGWRRLVSRDEALQLSGQHFWREEVVSERFDWGHEQGIFLLALRVARLRRGIELPMLPDYGGCRSWIELAVDVPDDSAIPVLDEAAYTRRIQALEAASGGRLTSFC